MLAGLMMGRALSIRSILDYAAIRGRVRQLASALLARGRVSKLDLRKLLKDYVLQTAA